MADDPQIAPNGEWIVWVHTWIEGDTNRYRSALCLTDRDGRETRRLTDGHALDTHPRPSPDGRWIAFLRMDAAAGLPSPQLCLLPVDGGGEAQILTRLHKGVSEPTWSPDGRRIAFTTPILPNEGLRRLEEGGEESDPYLRFNQDVHVATRRKWKMDGAGYIGDFRRAVACIDISPDGSRDPYLLAAGEFDLAAPTWSPEGRRLAAVGNIRADADATRRQYIVVINCAETLPAPPRELFGLEDVRHNGLAWSPDGSQIAIAGHNDARIGHYGNQHLWTVDVESGAARRITQDFDRILGVGAGTDVGRYGGHAGLHWLPDGDAILALVSDRGTVHPCIISVADGGISPLTYGDQVVSAFTVDAAGQTLALLVRAAEIPGDLFVVDLAQTPSVPQRITEVNREILAEVALAQPQRFVFRSEDGDLIDSWLLPPTERVPGRRYPLIYFHGGGPGGMRASNFTFEYQILAAAGYGVVYCNARGCQGYGEAFCTAILGDWGGADFDDIMQAVDEACARFDFLDGERLGIAGGSYGGYHVNWAIGHTDRFRAAVSDRSVFNRTATYGTSDIGHLREFEFGDGPPWQTVDAYLDQSPITFIANASTPTLVIHSAQDYRCPIEQGEGLYLTLKQLGVPTELVRFPDEGHELSRSGKPWHRVFRLEKYLGWFGQWLKEDDEMMR
jgi:dipeptidyl aminopeptidase/acylaminoacyl peptidase